MCPREQLCDCDVSAMRECSALQRLVNRQIGRQKCDKQADAVPYMGECGGRCSLQVVLERRERAVPQVAGKAANSRRAQQEQRGAPLQQCS